jgi:hypothetical protein
MGAADMVKRNRTIVAMLAGCALLAVSNNGGAHLKLAMENRADPNPRQISLGVELAGLCLGVIVSWSEHLRPEID